MNRRTVKTNAQFAKVRRYPITERSSRALGGHEGAENVDGGSRSTGAFADTFAAPRLTDLARGQAGPWRASQAHRRWGADSTYGQCRVGGGARAARVSRWARMAAITRGSVMTASTRTAAPQRGQRLMSMSNTQAASAAPRSWRRGFAPLWPRCRRAQARMAGREPRGGGGKRWARGLRDNRYEYAWANTAQSCFHRRSEESITSGPGAALKRYRLWTFIVAGTVGVRYGL